MNFSNSKVKCNNYIQMPFMWKKKLSRKELLYFKHNYSYYNSYGIPIFISLQLNTKWISKLIDSGCFVQLLSHVRLYATPWTATRQATLAFIISQILFKLRSFESVMPSNHLWIRNQVSTLISTLFYISLILYLCAYLFFFSLFKFKDLIGFIKQFMNWAVSHVPCRNGLGGTTPSCFF